MPIQLFPQRLLVFSESWRIGSNARTGGQSFTGVEQFVVNPASRWEAKISFHCVEDDDYLEADGFIAGLDGPATPFYLPVYDWRGRPWNTDPLSGSLITPRQAKRSYAVDPAYKNNPDTTGDISFVLRDAASMNSTSIVIQRNAGGALKRGQKFSLNGRLHIIIALTSEDPKDQSGAPIPGAVSVNIRPWLREDYPAGQIADFANPIAIVRLTPESSAMVERGTSPLSDLSLDLVEHTG